jgi:hypothetical protein
LERPKNGYIGRITGIKSSGRETSPQTYQTDLKAHSVSVPMASGFFPGAKQAKRDVDHSHPPGSKVKHEWTYTFTPSIYIHGVDRDNCTFLYEHRTYAFIFEGK